MAAFFRKMPRWLRRAALALAALVLIASIPIARNELACQVEPMPLAGTKHVILDPQYRRDEQNSYLTYPEWAIVHAYEDLAGVTRNSSESDFAYFSRIRGFWSSLCDLTRVASSRGPISLEYKVTLYTIGLSFAAEMGVKGLYEKTIGRVTAWFRGPGRVPEDEFALRVADEYAVFLQQTPWYEFPFGTKLRQFWSETPFRATSLVRSLERRAALSLEYGAKAVYAQLIGFGAAAMPADLSIRSVVRGNVVPLTDPRVSIVGAVDGATIIETPRYRAFTEVLRKLSTGGHDMLEIAGNDDILLTFLLPIGNETGSSIKGTRLFAVPLQARPGWQRIGFDVKVADLLAVMRQIEDTDIELEHVYDY